MADDNEDLQADEELPAPAEDSFEQLENDSPAERSGHVAVTDGRCMYVWGGYKVGGHHPQALRVRLGGYKVRGQHPQALHLRLGGYKVRGCHPRVLHVHLAGYKVRPCCLWCW